MTPATETVSSYRNLFAVPGFARLVASTLLVRSAGGMWQLALVLFVLQRFHSPELAGLTVFLSIAPGIVVSPLAGVLLDRHGRVRLMLVPLTFDRCIVSRANSARFTADTISQRREFRQFTAEQRAAEQELAALAVEQQQAMTGIPEDLLDHYQRIARRHKGVAMAEIRDETCTLCGVRVRPHVFQELRRDDNHEIFHCETCTRILYYVEQPVAQASSSASES